MLGQSGFAWMKAIVATESGVTVRIPEQRPFDQFLCHRIIKSGQQRRCVAILWRCCTSAIACFTATRSADSCVAGVESAALVGSRGSRILGPSARSECFASVCDWCL